MKKLFFAVFSLALIGAAGAAGAQELTKSVGAKILTSPYYVNSRTVRNFIHCYPTAIGVKWDRLKGGGSVSSFFLEGVKGMAYFTNHGNWITSIYSYDEKGLPKDIRTLVKRTYFDYRISFVNEIETPGQPRVYLVQVQDDKSMLTLRIREDEMDVVRELERS